MNIGIVTEYYYPLLGGISENVHHTAVELLARGHNVTVVTSDPPEAVKPAIPVPNGVAVVRVGRSVTFKANGARANAAVGGVRLWKELQSTLRDGRFDILQLHSPLNFTLPALATVQGPAPRVGTFHSYFGPNPFYAMFRNVLQREFVRRLHGVTLVSRSVSAALSRYFQMNARVIPNGIDTNAFHPGVPRLERFDTSKRTLLFLGRFEPRNGLPFMLRTFARLRQRTDDVRLVIVGSGGDPREYEPLIPDRIRRDVHFEGPALIERPGYYATADIFCSPISRASFGITLLEAMASGTPIVATENVGYRDLLSQEESVLVPYDEERFAGALSELLSDSRRRRAMGIAGRWKAERYAWPVVVGSLLTYFNEVLSRT